MSIPIEGKLADVWQMSRLSQQRLPDIPQMSVQSIELGLVHRLDRCHYLLGDISQMSGRCLDIASDVCQLSPRYLSECFVFFLCRSLFYETMFLHRLGVLPGQQSLRANKVFRGKERRHPVLVEAAGDEWIAVLIMFVECVFVCL